ncbi:MAG: T9SS type A sorting domain-containing protein, partial [Bacteroidota bacterium]
KLSPYAINRTAVNGVQLNSTYFVSGTNAGKNAGTEYYIKFPFKKGFAYDVKANVFTSINNYPDDQGAMDVTLRYNTVVDDTHSSSSCTDDLTAFFMPVGGIYSQQAAIGSSATDVHLPPFIAGANNGYLYIAGNMVIGLPHDPNATTTSGSVYIKSVNFAETSTLTFAPTTLALTCGDQTARTFTVNNPEGITGTFSYSWNVGAGWQYNGSVPTGPVVTTTNSIVLTPVNSASVVPNNISVGVSVNGTVINTFTCTVSTSNPAQTVSVTQANNGAAVCSGAPQTFVANGVPAGASVTWSVYPAGVASPSQGSTTTSLSYQSNGIVSLVATAANSCGSWQGTYQNIPVGIPPTPTAVEGIGGTITSFPANSLATFELYPVQYGPNYVIPNGNWTIYGGTVTDGQGTNSVAVQIGPNAGYLQVYVNLFNTCGASGTYHIQGTILNCPNCPAPRSVMPQLTAGQDPASDSLLSPTIYPNPASGNLHVHLAMGANAKSYIKVYDINSRLVRTVIPQGTDVLIDVSGLARGVYFVEIFNDGQMTTKKFIKQ